jgi:hypothetical protein
MLIHLCVWMEPQIVFCRKFLRSSWVFLFIVVLKNLPNHGTFSMNLSSGFLICFNWMQFLSPAQLTIRAHPDDFSLRQFWVTLLLKSMLSNLTCSTLTESSAGIRAFTRQVCSPQFSSGILPLSPFSDSSVFVTSWSRMWLGHISIHRPCWVRVYSMSREFCFSTQHFPLENSPCGEFLPLSCFSFTFPISWD